jgi:hypothetical protein
VTINQLLCPLDCVGIVIAGERSGVDEIPIVTDGVHTVICHSHFSTRLFLVRGGIPIPFMKINAASGPGLRFNLGRSMLAKPSNRKRAVEYLAASGVVPISVNERDGVCSIRAGGKSGNIPDWS